MFFKKYEWNMNRGEKGLYTVWFKVKLKLNTNKKDTYTSAYIRTYTRNSLLPIYNRIFAFETISSCEKRGDTED